eukprot:CAMPEP_0113717278 /NCGR_PEP_ID=MMETSP0038_2-20120614/34418_1 /TAXON_ID=2898 /ORGANISM="Cryptomonas paramecium" /LENGTH=53 /DNA_ID=CAMNT_0000645017 /DNA_START=75 /DNA_END=236 /DNA_ORIENTATION=- /assembly_acc=CAM_ASM_000170
MQSSPCGGGGGGLMRANSVVHEGQAFGRTQRLEELEARESRKSFGASDDGSMP